MASEGRPTLTPFIGKRGLKALGARAVEDRGSDVSGFAQKMMAKMGWEKGMGLGKANSGITTHVVVNKKDEAQGIGFNEQDDWANQWWFSSYKQSTLKAIGESGSDSDSDSDSDSGNAASGSGSAGASQSSHSKHRVLTDAELFAACGGRRLGMRARGEQSGKWQRAEEAVDKRVKKVLKASGAIDGKVSVYSDTYKTLLAAGSGANSSDKTLKKQKGTKKDKKSKKSRDTSATREPASASPAKEKKSKKDKKVKKSTDSDAIVDIKVGGKKRSRTLDGSEVDSGQQSAGAAPSTAKAKKAKKEKKEKKAKNAAKQ